MPTATITINAKEKPAPGKKRWKVKSEAGHIFQVNPEDADSIQVGRRYEVNYKDDEFNHHKFRVIESTKEVAAQVQQAPQGQSYYAPPQEDERGMDIATLAIAKPWLERVPVGDSNAAVHTLRMARLAWKKFKANPDVKDIADDRRE